MQTNIIKEKLLIYQMEIVLDAIDQEIILTN